MKSKQTWFLSFLVLIPFLCLMSLGLWTVWQKGWMLGLGILFPVCWGIAYFLAQDGEQFASPSRTRFRSASHWTERA